MVGISTGAMQHQLLPPLPSVLMIQEPVTNVVPSTNKKRILAKQLSMRETSREAKWERRRRQILHQRQIKKVTEDRERGDDCRDYYDSDVERECENFYANERVMRTSASARKLTDEDFDELKGSIDLGFGFNEGNGGHNLCNTLPALDLYFAVNRQFPDPKILSPSSSCSTSPFPSPRRSSELSPSESFKICSPGDSPQDIKARLRQWAQAVGCSVRQCS